jgi:hypothetical protein
MKKTAYGFTVNSSLRSELSTQYETNLVRSFEMNPKEFYSAMADNKKAHTAPFQV